MNNPLAALVQMLRGGGDPQQMLGRMMQQNPQLSQAMRLLEGKSQQQQMQLLENMARERGVDLGSLKQQLGQMLGMPIK